MTSLPPRSIRPSYVAVAPSTPAHAPVKVKSTVLPSAISRMSSPGMVGVSGIGGSFVGGTSAWTFTGFSIEKGSNALSL